MLKEGDKAPSFSLKCQFGKVHRLSDYKGKWVVLYFYPKDMTPGCTKEACSFRDNLSKIRELGVVVLGISKDSIESHKKFYDKYALNFTLLSDPTMEVIKKYGAYGKKKLYGKVYEGILRQTFIINPKGRIAKVFRKVKPLEHAKEVLEYLMSVV